jgi:hypothetical protein
VKADLRIQAKKMVETSAATDISTQKPIVKYSLLQKKFIHPRIVHRGYEPCRCRPGKNHG